MKSSRREKKRQHPTRIKKTEMDLRNQCKEEGGWFGVFDYGVLAVVLIVSSLIGIIFSRRSRGTQETSEDFFVGGSLGTVPTALSLGAGFITAIELLGNPAEVYSHGTQFWMICLSFLLVVPVTSYLFLPVFMKLRLTSSYEYLELRFNRTTRVFAAVMYIAQTVFYTSVAVYAPALALSNVTGLNTYVAVTVVYVVCVFYASQGGMKAVIMTDTFQSAVLLVSIAAVLFTGLALTPGGVERVYESNLSSGRFEFFIMNSSLVVRHSFWSVVVGGTFYWATMFCSNQATIQKYLSVDSIRSARMALWASSFGLVLVFTINFCTGLVLYDYYKGCDPFLNREISDMDELLPYYVINALGNLTGVPGLFVSGIFAASLGTVASSVNSLSAVTLKDLVSGPCGFALPAERGRSLSKWISLFYGLASFCLVFVVERLGGVLQLALSFNGLTGGVTLGLFSLGVLFPWAESKGALAGGLSGLLLVGWIGLGAQATMATTGWEPGDAKPVSVLGCFCNRTLSDEVHAEPSLWVYKISYLWYSAIGCLCTFLVGAAVSLAAGPERPYRLNHDLLAPPVKHLMFALPPGLQSRLWVVQEVKDQDVKEVKSPPANESKVEEKV